MRFLSRFLTDPCTMRGVRRGWWRCEVFFDIKNRDRNAGHCIFTIMQGWFNKNFLPKEHSIKLTWLLATLIIIFIPHLVISYRLLDETMMQDLHSRIIGSRLMEAGRSAYFFKWHNGDDTQLFNPNIAMPFGLNGVTATPFFLWIQKPLDGFSYCQIKLIWWSMEEILLFATLVLTCIVPKKLGGQFVAIIVSSVFFCYSRNWWQHICSGQYYILFAFIFALMVFLFQRNKQIALIAFPVVVLIRPLFALASLPWLIKDTGKNFKQLIIGGVLAMLLLLLSGTFKNVPEYSKAMKLYSSEITGWNNQQLRGLVSNQPQVMEDCVSETNVKDRFGAGCLFSVQHYLKLFRIKISEPLFFTAMLCLFIVAFFLVTGYKNITAEVDTVLIASFLIYIFSELFTPANRNPYNMIQYLGVMGLVINRASLITLSLLVSGLALNHDFPFRFTYQREIGEIFILLSIYLILLKARGNKTPSQQLIK